MSRDPLPANDDAFYDPPEPMGTRKKWSAKKLWLFAIVLFFLATLGLFARQPIANFVEFQMLPAETKQIVQTGKISGVKLPNQPLQGYGIWRLGIQSETGKAVVELAGGGRCNRNLAILSRDHQRIEKTIIDAFYDDSMERFDEKARLRDYDFLPGYPFQEFGFAPTDQEILDAVTPFLPQLESHRNKHANAREEK